MRKLALCPILVLLLVVILTACGRVPPVSQTPTVTPVTMTPTPRVTSTPLPPPPALPFTPMPPDLLSPIVIQHSPSRGQTLTPDGAVELVFDKPMDQQAVAKALRVERAGAAEPIAGTLSWTDNRTAHFQPSAALPRDTSFDVILTQDAAAQTGEPLGAPFTFRFATAGYLEVAQAIPAPDTIDVETDAAITVIFNRPVVPLTTIAEMDNLPHPLSFEPAIAGSGEWVNTSIYVFTPDEPLAGGLTYQATVSAELQDIAGATLPEAYSWRFSTLPPAVTWVTPREDSTLVDINTPIRMQFNQPIDLTSAGEAFHLSSGGLLGGTVRGTYGVEGSTLIFTPAQSLDFNTRYTANLDAGVTSSAGGEGMAQPFGWRFTTVPLPNIVETYPADGNRNAPPNTEFRIVFNTPIDPATVMPNLTMTPPMSPTLVYTYYAEYNNTFVLYFGAEPSSDYVVTIDDGIADPYGNTIPRGRIVRFRTGPLSPSYQLRIPDFVSTYDAGLPAHLALTYINLNRVDLKLYRLPLSTITDRLWEWQYQDRAPGQDALLREWEERLEAPLNKQQTTVVDLTETTDGTLAPGVYLLDVDAPDLDPNQYLRHQRHILVVSDLNLTLKAGAEDALIWVTDLATGAPVPNLALTVVESDGAFRRTAVTDRDGVAGLDLPRDHYTILAYSEAPFGAVSADWGRGIGPWDFGVNEGMAGQRQRTYIYTDRPIYRPGQTVAFKGVLRAEEDAIYSLPGVTQVTVTIRDVTGEELLNKPLAVSDQGTFEGTLALSDGAALGDYAISAAFGDDYSQATFTVAEYRAPEFQIAVSADQDEMQKGDDLNAEIALSYFFGGPLRDTPVAWHVLAERYTFEPPWGGRYTFSDIEDPYTCFDCWWQEPTNPEPLLSGQGTTGPDGILRVHIDGSELADALGRGPQRITFEATATGPDNQEIAGRTSTIVHPGPFYIGLQARSYVGEAGEESNIDLVVVDWQGERQPDTPVHVTFYRREWINTFVENDAGGGSWQWETKETKVDETTVTTDELGEAVATFVPAEGGSYHVVAEPANATSATQAIRSSMFIWVSGSNYVSWRRENNDRITLVSDKATYEVGDTAEILIPSPFEAPTMALVTVEREGVRRHEVIRLETNSAIYRLPIVEGDIPNVYVSVVLIKPRGGDVAALKMGLLPLAVDLGPKTLDVSIEADRDQAQPGESVTYALTALTPEGRPAAGAELSLDLIDKAVLSLKPRTDDILHRLYAARMLQVFTAGGLTVSENRYLKELSDELNLSENLLAQYGLGGGGDAMDKALVPMEAPAPMATSVASEAREGMRSSASAPEGVEVREEFADTAFWSPRVTTDSEGKASVTVTLPDNLTTWVARTVGLTAKTVVGEATAEVVATKPLLVRPVAPRFFVVDDRAQLAANVSNNTDAALSVDVGLSTGGLQIAADTPAHQTVSVPAHAEAKVTWWVTVEDVTDADLIFSADLRHLYRCQQASPDHGSGWHPSGAALYLPGHRGNRRAAHRRGLANRGHRTPARFR